MSKFSFLMDPGSDANRQIRRGRVLTGAAAHIHTLEQEKIRLFHKEDPLGKILRDEMLIFEYEMTPSGLIRYQAPEGYHDDSVIALALANWGVQQGGQGYFGFSKDNWR